jgi:hypothetical protein
LTGPLPGGAMQPSDSDDDDIVDGADDLPDDIPNDELTTIEAQVPGGTVPDTDVDAPVVGTPVSDDEIDAGATR